MKKMNTLLTALTIVAILASCSNQPTEDKANAFVERSIAYEKQGQYRAALIEMRNAIQADPDNVDFINRYAEVLIEIGQPNQAQSVLEQVDSSDPMAKLTLANAYLLQGKYVSADALIQSLKQTELSDTAELKALQAKQALLSGNRLAAIKIYDELFTSSDTPLQTKFEYVQVLLQNNQVRAAQAKINELSKSASSDPELLYLQAVIAYQQDNLTGAEKALTDALIELPETDMLLNERLQVLELLSDVLTKLGRPDEALIYNKIIREANPEAFVAKQQYRDALDSASEGDLESAKAAFEDILNQFPNNQQASLLLGLIHVEEGDMLTGEALLSENIDAETAPSSIVQATALAQADQGKYQEAMAVLDKALLTRPDDTTLLSLYGVVSLNNGKTQQGITAISKALQLNPNLTRLHLLLAQYHIDNDRTDMAFGHLRKAYNQNPTDWATTTFFITKLIENNETAEARTVRNDIADVYSDDPSALWIVSVTDYQLGNLEAAIDGMETLHQMSPANANVIQALARLYERAERFSLASEMWLKAVEQQPNSIRFVQSLVAAKSRADESVSLVDWLVAEANAKPEIALPLHSATVEILISQGNLPAAIELSSRYQDSNDPMVKTMGANILRGEAIILANNGEFDEAFAKANGALEIMPNNINLLVLNARLLEELDNVAAARDLLESAINSGNRHVRLISETALLIRRTDSDEAALAYLSPIWTNSPSGALAQTYFGLIGTDDPERLMVAAEELNQAEPRNTGALTLLGNLNLEKGNNLAAIRHYENAISVNANLVPALNNLAWLTRESEPQKALSYAQQAATLAPNAASVLDTYGWLLHLNGKKTEAIEVLERALTIDEGNADIQAHLEQVQG